jgi:polyhydroxybutyrate depolymerase
VTGVMTRVRARLRRRVLAGVGVAIAAVVVASALWSASGSHATGPHALGLRTHAHAAAAHSPPAQEASIRWSTGTMTVGGLQRAWWLAVPGRPLRPRLPLVLVLHGRGATPLDEATRTGLLPQVAKGRLIAAYPEGVDASWDAGSCCGDAYAAHVDDVTFLGSLLRRLQSLPTVLPDSVAVVGFSNGGKMALRLACSGALQQGDHPVRAIAVVAAAAMSPCASGPRVPLIQVAGTEDPLVPYTKAPAAPAPGIPPTSVLKEFAAWRQQAGCESAPQAGAVAPLHVAEWTCTGGPLELATDVGGGHAWPPGATDAIWTFLTPLLTTPIAPRHTAG